MRILGIDPALTITGYGVVDTRGRRLALLEAGIIKTSSRQVLAERLNALFCAVTTLLADTKPDVAVLEKLYAHYRHPTTAYVLGHARGAIILACSRKNVPVVEYAATRVKKAIVGKGLAPKYQVQRMIVSTLNLASLPRHTDVTDALALAVAHSYILRSKI